MGVLQDGQKFVAFGVQQAQRRIQVRIAGLGEAQAIESLLDPLTMVWRRLQAVLLQTLVQLPERPLGRLLRLPMGCDQRDQAIDLPLAMHPAQPVDKAEDLELRRVVADQPEFGVPGFRQERPAQGRLRDQPTVVRVGQLPLGELLFPSLPAEPTAVRLAGQTLLQLPAGTEPFQRLLRFLAPAILFLRLAQQTEEVQPRLGIAGGETGEQFVADMGADGGTAAMPGRRVIAVQVVADLPSHRQQFVLLGMKLLVSLQQQPRQLACRNVDSPFPQFLQQPSLGDVVLMDLQEDVLLQADPKVRIDSRQPRGHAYSTVGQSIHGPPIARRVCLDDQVLDHEVPIAFQPRVRRTPTASVRPPESRRPRSGSAAVPEGLDCSWPPA